MVAAGALSAASAVAASGFAGIGAAAEAAAGGAAGGAAGAAEGGGGTAAAAEPAAAVAAAVAAVAAVGLAAFVLRHGKEKQDRPNPFATGPDDYIIKNEANTIVYSWSFSDVCDTLFCLVNLGEKK